MVLPAVKLKICPLYKYDFPSAYHGDAGFSDGTDGGNLKSATCQSREVAPEKTCLTQSDPEETELMVSSSDQHLLRPAPPQTSTSCSGAQQEHGALSDSPPQEGKETQRKQPSSRALVLMKLHPHTGKPWTLPRPVGSKVSPLAADPNVLLLPPLLLPR